MPKFRVRVSRTKYSWLTVEAPNETVIYDIITGSKGFEKQHAEAWSNVDASQPDDSYPLIEAVFHVPEDEVKSG